MIGALLAKIASVIFKKALFGGLIKSLATAYEIYSVFDTASDLIDCIETTNDCNDLGVIGVKVISEPLVELVYDKLVSVGSDTYTVEKTSSGIYVASRLAPTYKINDYSFPSEVFAGGKGSFNSGKSSNFRTGGRGSFNSGGKNF